MEEENNTFCMQNMHMQKWSHAT